MTEIVIELSLRLAANWLVGKIMKVIETKVL